MDISVAKAAYNAHLRNARNSAKAAAKIREAIVSEQPKFKGPSQQHLTNAIESLGNVRRFNVE